MTLLKFQARQLFTGDRMLNSDHVLITDKWGTIQDIVFAENAGDDIRQLDGILTPGFINAHCHLELSHLKGVIAEHSGLVDFVFKVVTQRHFPEEEILVAIEKAENEMLVNGIVAVGDICNNTSSFFVKKKRRIAYYNFIEVSGWAPQIAAQRFTKSKTLYDHFSVLFSDTSMAPHAPYSVSDPLWQLITPYFSDKTTTIHNQETIFEDELFLRGQGALLHIYEKMNINNGFFHPTGKTSLQSYFHKLRSAKHIILVHNTYTTEEDILFAKMNNKISYINWCLCANANQYIENVLPPIELMRKHHCNIVIGTDSLASNRSLSILDELKTINKNFPYIPLTELLQWATINGSRALGMGNKLGSFEKGKQPGVIVLKNIEEGKLNNALIERII